MKKELKFILVENPTGTIHGDLNAKLSNDLCSAIKRNIELNIELGVDRQLTLSGVFSMYANVLASMEKWLDIPPVVFDTFLSEIRKKYDIPSRRG